MLSLQVNTTQPIVVCKTASPLQQSGRDRARNEGQNYRGTSLPQAPPDAEVRVLCEPCP